MFFQNTACSSDAVARSASPSIPSELSPPLVAAMMSGRSCAVSCGGMVFSYTQGRKKISNRFRIVTSMGTDRAKPVTRPFEGEDIETEHWEDARHWMSIY